MGHVELLREWIDVRIEASASGTLHNLASIPTFLVAMATAAYSWRFACSRPVRLGRLH
jgi:hypothetical protein